MAKVKKATEPVNGKQKYIEGTEPPSIPEIDEKAGQYKKVRDKRMDLTEQEIELKGELRELMLKHKLDTYVVPDTEMQVDLEPGEAEIKVRKRKAAEAV